MYNPIDIYYAKALRASFQQILERETGSARKVVLVEFSWIQCQYDHIYGVRESLAAFMVTFNYII